jgi:hypothetical protein
MAKKPEVDYSGAMDASLRRNRMRLARAIIAAVALLSSLGGCLNYGYYPTPQIATAPGPVPLTLCGRCEEHVVEIPPTPIPQ